MKVKHVLAGLLPICIGTAVIMGIQSGLFSASNLSLTLRSIGAVFAKSVLGDHADSTYAKVAQAASISLAFIALYAREFCRDSGSAKSKFK